MNLYNEKMVQSLRVKEIHKLEGKAFKQCIYEGGLMINIS